MPTVLDSRGLQRLVERARDLGEKGEVAVQRAKSTVGRRIKPEARRSLQAEFNLPAFRILDGLRSRVTADAVELTASGKGVNIVSYGARWNPRRDGAEVQIRKGGKREVRPGAFIRNGANGNRVGLERKRQGGSEYSDGPRVGRYPLKGVYGPSVAQQLAQQEIGDELAELAQNTLSSELDRLLR
jgi:hypothetical protein